MLVCCLVACRIGTGVDICIVSRSCCFDTRVCWCLTWDHWYSLLVFDGVDVGDGDGDDDDDDDGDGDSNIGIISNQHKSWVTARAASS